MSVLKQRSPVGYANACMVICLDCAAKIIGRRNERDWEAEHDGDQDCMECGRDLNLVAALHNAEKAVTA